MNNQIRGILYTVISSILFGLMPLITKIAYQYGTNAYMVSLGRFFFGSVFLALLCMFNKKKLMLPKADLKKLLLLAFPYSLVPIILYSAYRYIDSGLATILHFSYPLQVVLLSLIFFKRKPGIKQIACELLCLVGIGLLAYDYGLQNVKGMLIALISGLVYACYIILLENKKPAEIDTSVLTFWLTSFSFVIILPITLLTHNLKFTGSLIPLVCFVVLALLATLIGTRLFQTGILLIGSIKASLLSTFEPITGIIVGVLVFNEALTFKEVLAIGLILLAACLIVMPSIKKERNYGKDLSFRK